MPVCAKCNKRTFDGTRWNSTAPHKELDGKYLCLSCYQETEKEFAEDNKTLEAQKQQQQIETQKEMLNSEIQATENKLKTLEEMKSKDDLSAFSVPQTHEESKKPSFLWVIVAGVLGAVGGLIGYLVLKEKHRKFANYLLIFGIIVTVIIASVEIGIILSPSTSGQVQGPQQWSIEIVPNGGQATVLAGHHIDYPVVVPSDARKPSVCGDFTAQGGNDNGIKCYVFDGGNYNAYLGGAGFNAIYQSGQTNSGSINVSLSAGETYYLVFDNGFSSSDKSVSTQAALEYVTPS